MKTTISPPGFKILPGTIPRTPSYLLALGSVLALVCAFTNASLGAETRSMGSGTDASATRTSLTTGLVDAWQVGPGSVVLVSLFGYNNGAQQFVQLYDCTNAVAPTVAITGFDNVANTMTNVNHGLATGQKIQLTGTVAGQAAGIYYVIVVDTNRFELSDTLAHARAGTALSLSGASASATLNLVPMHFFAVAAADNFSCIVPDTGMKFGRGLLITLSTTGPLYTAPTKDAEFYVTRNQGP